MGKKRKWGSLTTLLLALTLVVSACGGNNGGNNGGGNGSAGGNEAAGNTGTAAEDGKPDGKPVHLIWYTVGTPQKDVDTVMAEVNKYTADKIGVTVEMKMIDWGDYNQKMQVMVASGEPMDILFTASWAFDYVQNARKGAFAELDGLLDQYGQGIKEVLDPAFLTGSKVDGHNYGVPANKELPAQEVWRFNKTLVDKYKLDISGVRSLESLEPLLKTIKDSEPNVTPFAITKDYIPVVPYDYVIEKLPMGVKLDSTDYKIVNLLETQEMKDALNTMRKYYKAGYVPSEAATLAPTADLQAAGNWLTDRATTQPFADNLWSTSYGYPVVSTPATDAYIFNWSVMGSMQAISANSEHQAEAMKFLNLLNTDAYLRNLVDSGIENVHYKKTGDNVMENLPESKNYDMPTFALGNIMLTYLNPNDPADKWEQFKAFNDAGKPAPLLGFNFDTTSVTTELAAVQNVREEFWSPLMTGSVDPDEYLPKALEKFKAAGLDKILAEAQRQLDEWRAANK